MPQWQTQLIVASLKTTLVFFKYISRYLFAVSQ